MTDQTNNVVEFPGAAQPFEEEAIEVMDAARARWAMIRQNVRSLIAELGGDEGACTEIEALTIEVVAEHGGKSFAAGVAEKVAARLRREDGHGGAA